MQELAKSQFYNYEKNAKNVKCANFHIFQICFQIIAPELSSYMKCHDIPANGSESIANNHLF